MSEPIAVLALRRKRDQISGTIAHYERLIREAEHDLAHVNAALRLFEVTGEACDLPPYVDLNRLLSIARPTCRSSIPKSFSPRSNSTPLFRKSASRVNSDRNGKLANHQLSEACHRSDDRVAFVDTSLRRPSTRNRRNLYGPSELNDRR
jgi:hypothetical protein